MLRLTQVVGAPVLVGGSGGSAGGGRAVGGGSPAGRVADLVIDVGRTDAGLPAAPVVTRLVIRPTRTTRAWVPWRDVRHAGPDEVVLREGATFAPADQLDQAVESAPTEPAGASPARDDEPLRAQELLLGRDVLDAQIVDLTGHRLVRAADVLLVAEGSELVVVGVDVDFRTVLRRLRPGRPRAVPVAPAHLVPWDELHLTSRRGHKVQLVSANAHLHRLSADDLAHLLARLSTSHARALLQAAPVERAAEAISASHDEVGRRVLASMDEADAHAVLEALPPERAHALRRAMARVAHPRRRYHRTRGWKRHAPHRRAAHDR